MRIAYLVNHYPAVSHSFIRREILALERQGHEVLRTALRGWQEQPISAEDQVEQKRTRYLLEAGALPLLAAILNLTVTSPALVLAAARLVWTTRRHAERPFLIQLIYLFEAARLVLWLRGEKIEHLHAHFGTNSAQVAMLANAMGGPTFSFTAHGPEEFDKPAMIALPEKIKRAAFVVAVSSFGRSQLYRQASHEQWHKIHVVHCGLEKAFHEQAAPGDAGDSRRLVCVGRLCEQKGQALLIDAARQLVKRGLEFELVLAGDGEMRGDLEQMIEQYQLGSTVKITGWISSDRVREEILAARALVLPSFAEGLPVVLMEAMALRRPVISTFVAGIPELIKPGEHGWLVPAGDVESLATAMEECLQESTETIDAMGAKARRQVLSRHDIDQEAVKLATLFARTSGNH